MTHPDRRRTKATLFVAALLVLLIHRSPLLSQDIEGDGYLSSPMPTAAGIVCTDNLASKIYLLVSQRQVIELAASPGCGRFVSVSRDRDAIGFKLIQADGLQIPVVLNLRTRRIMPLHRAVERVGQVSFARDGRCAFTIDNTLVVVDGVRQDKHDLGTYCNLAPISPDGNFVVYNDSRDRIILMDLQTGKWFAISDAKRGYFNPQWSPDGQRILYSSLGGTVLVYDLETKQSFDLGSGFNPAWSRDSRKIIYAERKKEGLTLVSSDLFCVTYDGTTRTQLTNSPDVFEMDPQFGEGDNSVVYHTYTRREIVIAELRENRIGTRNTISLPPLKLQVTQPLIDEASGIQALDIPHVHQVYDTPDWFNGHWACAPTTSIMVIAYYHLLPPWDTWCSWPTPGHNNDWGNYVSERYNFRQYAFALEANDPNSRPAQGGFGFMWNGSASPYSRMVDYYQKHGLTAARLDEPAHSIAVGEANAEYPFTICVGLTTAGHVVLVHGLGTEQHTVIVNDPYGNKNSPGYPNYGGKDARYDWPGYNNGFQNLNQVYWGVTTRPPATVVSDTVVDDLDFSRGFYLHNRAPSSMAYWRDLNRGYRGHMWWTYTRASAPTDTCYATWRPALHRAGQYEVFAYIPISNATAAYYKVQTLESVRTVVIDQHNYTEAWASLGIYNFGEGSQGSVSLGNTSDIAGQEIVFDAVAWVLRDTTLASLDEQSAGDRPRDFTLEQNYPNPFNPTTTISYSIPHSANVTLAIYNVLGEQLTSLVHEHQTAGTYTQVWNAEGIASGLYLIRLSADNLVGTRKALVLK